MTDGVVTREHALEVHAAASDAFVELVRAMPIDPAPVRNLEWSTLEVAAHVLSMQRALLDTLSGHGGWQSLYDSSDENERLLAATRERRPGEVARALGPASEALRAAWAQCPTDIVGWHAGVKAPIEAVIGANAADILVHGLDIARALKRPWDISPDAATVAVDASLALAPLFPSAHAEHVDVTYAIRLRTGPTYTVTVARGTIEVAPGRPERADCKITADPVAFLLVGTGRIGRMRAMVRGKIRSSGRRPWLGLQFPALIDFP